MTNMKKDLVSLVGDDQFLDDPDVLASYASDESFVLSIKPKAVVRPGSEDEVQALVAWANQTGHAFGAREFRRAPLLRRHRAQRARRGHGGSVPHGQDHQGRQPEPHRRDRARGHVRAAPAGSGQRGPGHRAAAVPSGQQIGRRQPPGAAAHPDAPVQLHAHRTASQLRGGVGRRAEVHDGESGNSVPEVEAQWNAGRRLLDPKGPAQTDFFRLLTGAQGTLGIVTWASVRVQLIPDPKKTLFVSAPKLDDLVDLSYRLTRLRLGDELLIVNAAYLAALLAADSVEAAALRKALPAWTLIIGIGGRALRGPQRVAAAEQDIAGEVAARGLKLQAALPGVTSSRVDAVLGGVGAEPALEAARQGRRGRHLLSHHPGERSGPPGHHAAMRGRPRLPSGRHRRLPAAATPGCVVSHGVQPAVCGGGQGRRGQGPRALQRRQPAV